MGELVADCPRCGSKSITFVIGGHIPVRYEYGWQCWYETFCICRHCKRSTVFILSEKGIDESKIVRQDGLANFKGAVGDLVSIRGYISFKDAAPTPPPDHLPEKIRSVFTEGATCLAVDCFNAAGTMFRLCIDLVTKALLPETDENGLNSHIRRNLGLRLPWLFGNGRLPQSLQELSTCIKEDGNDGAHDGSLKKEDAEDLLDFTSALLERLYTEPERLRLAKLRRDARRGEAKLE